MSKSPGSMGFFEENVPQMVQNYQKEEEKWYEPSAEEKSTTVQLDFVNIYSALCPLWTPMRRDN